jgi:hypothetical protein
VAGFSLFDKIRNEDSHVTKTEGTRGVRYYICANSSTGIRYELYGIGNINGDSPNMLRVILMTNRR